MAGMIIEAGETIGLNVKPAKQENGGEDTSKKYRKQPSILNLGLKNFI